MTETTAGVEQRQYWLCCGSFNRSAHRRACIEAQSGHPERCRFGTRDEHDDWGRTRAEQPRPTASPAGVAAENEACAAIAETFCDNDLQVMLPPLREKIATAIRARMGEGRWPRMQQPSRSTKPKLNT